jgi:glyoxylase-like metal-dependent hydrolase (beta-lactamase superfamily II)
VPTRVLLALIVLVLAGCGREGPSPDDPQDAARVGRDIIARAIREAGSISDLADAGAFAIAGTGTLDKAAAGQGFSPGQPSAGPFRERLVFDFARQRFVREYREDRFDGTFEHLSEIHGSDSILTVLVHTHGIAVPSRAPGNDAARKALLRRLPHALLAEVSRDGATPRWLESANGTARVAALLQTGTPVTLAFDLTEGTLRALTYDTVLPARGRVSLSWTWDDWRTVNRFGRFPFRYAATVGEQPYLDVFVDSIAEAGDNAFATPASMRSLPLNIDTPASPTPIELQRIANGIFVAPDLRGGFAPLVIERARDVIAIDAPASFPLLGTIPFSETDPGPGISWVSERFVDAIRLRFPDKPIAFVILTHGHEDHTGGVRAFVAEGATVVGPPSIRADIERILGLPADVMRDRFAAAPRPLRFLDVQDSIRLDDTIRPIRVLDIEPNPHSDGLLAVHVLQPDVLFVSDIVTPAPLEVYPRAFHAALDYAFLRWFDANSFANPRILSMHGSGELTAQHLNRLRELVTGRDTSSH